MLSDTCVVSGHHLNMTSHQYNALNSVVLINLLVVAHG